MFAVNANLPESPGIGRLNLLIRQIIPDFNATHIEMDIDNSIAKWKKCSQRMRHP